MSGEEDSARERKSVANRSAYAKSKACHDQVLLRLDRGDAKCLDAASQVAGLSRSAFARLFLPALVTAISTRFAAINDARQASGESFGRFVGRALDRAIEEAKATHAVLPDAASEFDALFGAGSVDGSD